MKSKLVVSCDYLLRIKYNMSEKISAKAKCTLGVTLNETCITYKEKQLDYVEFDD